MSIAGFIALVAPLLAPNKLILSEQNGTRPPKPYATITVRSTRPARPQEGPVDASGIVQIDQQQLNAVEVQFYGDNAVDLANLLSAKLRYPSTQLLADQLNIGIARVNTVLRVPELLNTSQFEERAILEFTAYDTFTGNDNVGLIETVEIEGFDETGVITKPAEE
jgi:hypothetical protein